VARAIFYGQQGELRQRYREGQEDQLGALRLVVNTVVLWNTRYLDDALSWKQASSTFVKPEDVERLSPLLFAHIDVLGRYGFVHSSGGSTGRRGDGAARPTAVPCRQHQAPQRRLASSQPRN
jgi:hypothetical protein